MIQPEVVERFLSDVVPKRLQSRWRALMTGNKPRWEKLDISHLMAEMENVEEYRSTMADLESEYFGLSSKGVNRISFGHDRPRADVVSPSVALGGGPNGTFEGVIFSGDRCALLTHDGEVFIVENVK